MRKLKVKNRLRLQRILVKNYGCFHQNQVIHNDIHWINIMLKEFSDGSLIIKYVDFGCAKLFGLGVGPQQDFKDLGTIVS
jgi:tRNA A-37 threonylcarbamoyl transferase component Bud32